MATSASSRLSSAIYTPSSMLQQASGSASEGGSANSSSDESGLASSSLPGTPAAADSEAPASTATRPALARFRWETDSWLKHAGAWDLSGAKELSNLVKAGTAEAHRTVESSPMVGQILRASLPVNIHIKFLVMLYQIYDALEIALSEHAAHDRLARIYNPSVLARADLLGQDITYFLGLKPSENWKTHPSVASLLDNPPSALVEYVERIRALGRADGSLPSFEGYTYPPPPAESWLLLAHAYVRYLGDLNGGQTLKIRVAKAYGLDPAALDGLRFFEFDGRDGAIATPAELSRLSGAFKKGMDATGEALTPSERAAFLQEANHAFELNMRLFTSFEKDGDVSATLAPDAAQMPAPSNEKFAKASTYMERRAPTSSTTPKTPLKASAIKSGLPVSPGLLFLAIALPLYLLARLYMPGYLGWQ